MFHSYLLYSVPAGCICKDTVTTFSKFMLMFYCRNTIVIFKLTFFMLIFIMLCMAQVYVNTQEIKKIVVGSKQFWKIVD